MYLMDIRLNTVAMQLKPLVFFALSQNLNIYILYEKKNYDPKCCEEYNMQIKKF